MEVSGQLHLLVALPSAKETSLLIEWDIGTLEEMKSLSPRQESSHVPFVSIGIGGGVSDASLRVEMEFTFHKIEGYRNGIVLYLGLCFFTF